MAFPSVVATTSYVSSTTNATTWTPFSAETVVVGELLIFVASVDGSSTVGTSSTGWVRIGHAQNGAVVTGALFAKIATSTSESLTLDNGGITEQYSGTLYRISGANAVTASSANGSSTNSNPPSHTIPAAVDALWIATRSGDSTVVATVAPTNYTNLTSQTASGTAGASTNTAYRTINASSEDPGTFTSASEQWVSFTIAAWQEPTAVLTPTLVGTVAKPEGLSNGSGAWTALSGETVASGEFLIFVASHAAAAATITTSSTGWTKLNQVGSTTPQSIFTKTATGSSETLVLQSSAGAADTPFSGVLIRLANATSVSYQGAFISGNFNPPNLLTGITRNYLAIATASSNLVTTAGPSGYSGLTTADGDVFTAVAFKNVAGWNEDPGTFTHSGGDSAGHTLLVWGSTPDGVGSVGASSATGSASGVGQATSSAAATSSASASASGAGRAIAAAVGTTSASSSASATVSSLQSAVGSASATASSAASTQSRNHAVGAASAVAAISGAASSIASSAGSSAGSASSSGTASAKAIAAGASAGLGSASGVTDDAVTISSAAGSASASGTASGTARSFVNAQGSASGTGSSSSAGVARKNSAGSGTATGSAAATGRSVASAAGASSASGSAVGLTGSSSIASAVGTASASASASASANATAQAAGSSSASGSIQAGGVKIVSSAGSSSGTSDATAPSHTYATGVGLSAGFGVVVGEGSSIASASGLSSATSIAEGFIGPVNVRYPTVSRPTLGTSTRPSQYHSTRLRNISTGRR